MNLLALPYREIATKNLTTPDLQRWYNMSEGGWGGWNNTTAPVDFGTIAMHTAGVYTDIFGNVALLIFFMIPFIMMWLLNMNTGLKVGAVVGILIGGYVLYTIPQQYAVFAVGAISISVAAALWSMRK